MAFLLSLTLALVLPSGDASAVRVKDLGDWGGIRSNHLIGYGLVVGLAGTGDSDRSFFTVQSIASMLGRMGVRIPPARIRVRNVAAVIVTSELPPFARQGARIDVTASAIGNAKSLQGGVLLFTPLEAADGKVYAVAQGPLIVGGFSAEASGSSVSKNHPTVGRVPNGAFVEREIASDLSSLEVLSFHLSIFDFTTITRIAEAMAGTIEGGSDRVKAVDGGTVEIHLTESERAALPTVIAKLEELDVEPESSARVVVNERTGTVVAGRDVRISTVAVSHGSLRVEVTTTRSVSQPAPLSRGETKVVDESRLRAEEEGGRLRMIKGNVRLGDLVDALNALGATPRDLVDILQAIKAAGALHAELIIL